MKSLIKKITNKDEAKKVIKDATLLLYVFAGLELLLMLLAAPRHNFILISIVLVLITLLRKYQSRVSGFLLTVLFLLPLIYQAQNLFTSRGELEIIIEYIISIFLSIRATEATLKYHGRINISPQKMSCFYKFYLWFLFITIGYFSYDLYFLNEAKIFEYIDLPFTIFGLVGLFGYVYKKAFFNVIIWKWYFFIIILWDILYSIFLYVPHTTHNLTIGLKIGVFIFLFALLLPYYIALYLYGFKSDRIWNDQLT